MATGTQRQMIGGMPTGYQIRSTSSSSTSSSGSQESIQYLGWHGAPATDGTLRGTFSTTVEGLDASIMEVGQEMLGHQAAAGEAGGIFSGTTVANGNIFSSVGAWTATASGGAGAVLPPPVHVSRGASGRGTGTQSSSSCSSMEKVD